MPQPLARDRFFDLLRSSFADASFLKLTLGKYRGAESALRNIFVRPVMLKSGAHFSFVYRYATRDITHNHTPADALVLLGKLIGNDFLDAHAFTTTHTAQLACEANGDARIRVKAVSAEAERAKQANSTHDVARRYTIPANAPWLRALGVMNDRGHASEGMAAKFRQINKFVELLTHLAVEAKLMPELALIPETLLTPKEESSESRPLRIADMGCGKGYLTFATAAVLGTRAQIIGIEARAELVTFCNRIAQVQGMTNLSFQQGTIHDASLPERALDVLIALHACDTATDDAIAKGVAAGARLIVVSPCCHKQLRPQLTAPPILVEALRHGIFQERQAEFVTDALRAQLLEYAGYRTKVFEFISTEHTAKNVMITAIKVRERGEGVTADKLQEFARFYGIRRHALAEHFHVSLE